MALACVTAATTSQLTIPTDMVCTLHRLYHYALGTVQGHIYAQYHTNIIQDFTYHDDFFNASDDMEGDGLLEGDEKLMGVGVRWQGVSICQCVSACMRM